MQLFGALLGGSFVLASLVVGTRLVWLAGSTRRAAELWIGGGLLLQAVFGYPLMVVARRAEALPEPTREGLALLAALFLSVGTVGIMAFVRRVFRPDAFAASLALGAYALTSLGLALAQWLEPGWGRWIEAQQGPWAAARWITLVPICWGGIESLRYWIRMRRRQALGLADPLVTDRFRLFGISMLGGLMANSGTVACQVLGVDILGTTVGAVVVSPAGVAAVALWLAFLPPRAYRRHIVSRAVARAH